MNRNFNDIYKQIYTNGIEDIKAIEKERNISFIAFRVFFALFMIFLALFLNNISMFYNINNSFLLLASLFGVGTTISYRYYKKMNLLYKSIFKTAVMENIVKLYDNEFIYDANFGINSLEYRQSKFNKTFDYIYSEDLVQGEILNNILFKMSQVKITREYTNEDGTREEKLFEGLFGIVNMQDTVFSLIDVLPNDFSKKYDKSRIEMDSGTFEKYYDIFSADKVNAMKIFTSNVIEEINKFREDTGYEIQIRIVSNKIFFRIKCGDTFETPKIKNALDYSTLYKYFRMIDSPVNIITKLIENISKNYYIRNK